MVMKLVKEKKTPMKKSEPKSSMTVWRLGMLVGKRGEGGGGAAGRRTAEEG